MERMRNSLWTAYVWIDMPVSKRICAEGGLGGNKQVPSCKQGLLEGTRGLLCTFPTNWVWDSMRGPIGKMV